MTVILLCNGPGPHQPTSGIVGEGDVPIDGLRCASPACDYASDPVQILGRAQAANQTTLQSRAQAALTANANYLGLGSPTTAQAVAQVALLTKENNAVIRLLLGLLDSTGGT